MLLRFPLENLFLDLKLGAKNHKDVYNHYCERKLISNLNILFFVCIHLSSNVKSNIIYYEGVYKLAIARLLLIPTTLSFNKVVLRFIYTGLFLITSLN